MADQAGLSQLPAGVWLDCRLTPLAEGIPRTPPALSRTAQAICRAAPGLSARSCHRSPGDSSSICPSAAGIRDRHAQLRVDDVEADLGAVQLLENLMPG
jgi:hypothetical protein